MLVQFAFLKAGLYSYLDRSTTDHNNIIITDPDKHKMQEDTD